MKREQLTEEEMRQQILEEVNECLREKRGFIIASILPNGIKTMGYKISGKHEFQAAIALLQMSDKKAPIKAKHHIEQALCELREALKLARD